MKDALGWWHDLLAALHGIVGTYGPLILPSALARFIWHQDQVRAGKRPWFSVVLLCVEAATVLFSVYVAAGIAEFYELGPRATLALAGLCAWFGPSGLQALVLYWLNRQKPKA